MSGYFEGHTGQVIVDAFLLRADRFLDLFERLVVKIENIEILEWDDDDND